MKNAADIIKQALAVLEDENGRLTPEAVVDAAAEKDSPLHGLFEWDDSKAAHAHRLEQARGLIRSVRVEFEIKEMKVSSVAYVRDPALGHKEQGYLQVLELRQDTENARAAVVSACGLAAAHLRRARELANVLDMTAEFDNAIAGMAALRRKAAVAGATKQKSAPMAA